MKNLYNKIPFILLAAFTLPILAEKGNKDSEEPKSEYKVVFSGKKSLEKKSGKVQFKARVSLDDGDKMLHYNLNVLEVPVFGLIYESPDDQGNGFLNDFDLDFEELLKLIKKVIQEGYIEDKDKTGKQSFQCGIVSSHYGGSQMLGLQFKSPQIDLALSIESLVRLIFDEVYEKDSQGLAAVTLKWDFDEGDKLSVGVALAKGDYGDPDDEGSSLSSYLMGGQVTYKFGDPLIDFIQKISFQYTGYKAQKNSGKLAVVPGYECSCSLGKVKVWQEKPEVSLRIAWRLCDIAQKAAEQEFENGGPSHIKAEIGLKFSDPFGGKGLQVVTKGGIEVAKEEYQQGWNQKIEQKDYRTFRAFLLVNMKMELPLGEAYYAS